MSPGELVEPQLAGSTPGHAEPEGQSASQVVPLLLGWGPHEVMQDFRVHFLGVWKVGSEGRTRGTRKKLLQENVSDSRTCCCTIPDFSGQKINIPLSLKEILISLPQLIWPLIYKGKTKKHVDKFQNYKRIINSSFWKFSIYIFFYSKVCIQMWKRYPVN